MIPSTLPHDAPDEDEGLGYVGDDAVHNVDVATADDDGGDVVEHSRGAYIQKAGVPGF